MTPRKSDLGFTLIEAMTAIVVLLIGMLGLASLQIVGVRSNHMARHVQQASALATDLAENVLRWDYNDARITPTNLRAWNMKDATSTATETNETNLDRSDPPKHVSDGSAFTADFSDRAADTGARVSSALGAGYTGLSSDVDGDGAPDYVRYWNVWLTTVDPAVGATGKTIQIIVRWKEPGLGWRQITAETFKPLPNTTDLG